MEVAGDSWDRGRDHVEVLAQEKVLQPSHLKTELNSGSSNGVQAY